MAELLRRRSPLLRSKRLCDHIERLHHIIAVVMVLGVRLVQRSLIRGKRLCRYPEQRG